MKKDKLEVERVMQKPEEPTLVFVEALLMPNGEVLHMGKTLCFIQSDDFDYEFAVFKIKRETTL